MTSAKGRRPTAQQTVLVADGEVLVRMAVAQQLRECGYVVVEAANGEEALVVLQKSNASIHIVLAAVQMPGTIDGFTLAIWIRHHRPDLKVVLTGNEVRSATAAMELCACGPRPGRYEPQNLLAYIRRLKAARAVRAMLGHWRDVTSRRRQCK